MNGKCCRAGQEQSWGVAFGPFFPSHCLALMAGSCIPEIYNPRQCLGVWEGAWAQLMHKGRRLKFPVDCGWFLKFYMVLPQVLMFTPGNYMYATIIF